MSAQDDPIEIELSRLRDEIEALKIEVEGLREGLRHLDRLVGAEGADR